MKIEPFKMRVTPKQSAKVQEILFKNGHTWRDGSTKICLTNERFPYLLFDSLYEKLDGSVDETNPVYLYHCDQRTEVFESTKTPELTYEQFIQKYDK